MAKCHGVSQTCVNLTLTAKPPPCQISIMKLLKTCDNARRDLNYVSHCDADTFFIGCTSTKTANASLTGLTNLAGKFLGQKHSAGPERKEMSTFCPEFHRNKAHMPGQDSKGKAE